MHERLLTDDLRTGEPMTTISIYLAARYSRREELCGYRDQLHSIGAQVTSRWLDGNHQIDDRGAPITERGEALVEGGEHLIAARDVKVGMRVRVPGGTTEGDVTKVHLRKHIDRVYYRLDWRYGAYVFSCLGRDRMTVLPTAEHEAEAARLRTHFAVEDVDDVLAADLLVAFTEQPRSSASRGGRHVELGIALGRGIPVAVVGPRENVFCWLPQVDHYATWDEARERIGLAVQVGNQQPAGSVAAATGDRP